MKSPNFQEINSSKWLRWSLVFILTLGLFFRFVNLDKKIYWTDETFTSLSISGYTHSEVVQELYNNQIINLQDLKKFQYPNSEKTLVNTLQVLEADVHPPIYYIILRFWTQIWGNSIKVIRSFSAVVSLIAFPSIYWLCLELFGSSIVGWMAILLLAISPFHIGYAQEARMYSLWTVTILLCSAALLRATRLNTRLAWLIYSFTLALSFYTHWFSTLVALSQGVYIVISEKLRLNKKVFAYFFASLLALLIYLPWIVTLVKNWNSFKAASSWVENTNLDLLSLLVILINNISNTFVDFWFAYTYIPDFNFPNLRFGVWIKPLILGLIAYSIYFLCRNTPLKTWLFVLTLMTITPLLLIFRDLSSGTGSSTQARYLVACYLGIEISVAYLLVNKITNFNLSLWTRRGWQIITILLISLGIISCGISSQAESWSPKFMSNQHQVARFINQSANPLIISDGLPVWILSLSHRLNPNVKLQLLSTPNISETPNDFNEIFLFQPSAELRANLQGNKNYHLSRIKNINGLWRLEK